MYLVLYKIRCLARLHYLTQRYKYIIDTYSVLVTRSLKHLQKNAHVCCATFPLPPPCFKLQENSHDVSPSLVQVSLALFLCPSA